MPSAHIYYFFEVRSKDLLNLALTIHCLPKHLLRLFGGENDLVAFKLLWGILTSI
jgi:hypothetical protein